MKWPEYFPESCPPYDATEPNGLFYRLIVSDTPTSEDFTSNHFIYPERNQANECEACGLSFSKSIKGLMRLRKRYKAQRSKLIAEFQLTPGYGLVIDAPSEVDPGHVTFWIFQDKTILETVTRIL